MRHHRASQNVTDTSLHTGTTVTNTVTFSIVTHTVAVMLTAERPRLGRLRLRPVDPITKLIEKLLPMYNLYYDIAFDINSLFTRQVTF